MHVLSVLEQSGASIIALVLRNTHILAQKYSYRKIHFKTTLSKYTFENIDMKYFHYTMMHVSFERPRTIRASNNRSLAKKYPYFSTKIQL